MKLLLLTLLLLIAGTSLRSDVYTNENPASAVGNAGQDGRSSEGSRGGRYDRFDSVRTRRSAIGNERPRKFERPESRRSESEFGNPYSDSAPKD